MRAFLEQVLWLIHLWVLPGTFGAVTLVSALEQLEGCTSWTCHF